VICSVELHWTICEISEPYDLPEESRKRVRAKRTVSTWGWGPDTGTEKIGRARGVGERRAATGHVLWTPAREALLVEILAASVSSIDASSTCSRETPRSSRTRSTPPPRRIRAGLLRRTRVGS